MISFSPENLERKNHIENIALIQEIFDLQDSLNVQTSHPADWKKSGNNYLRALWIEAAELSDSIGYKWWKLSEKTQQQQLNIRLEIIDILHFLVSHLILLDYTASDLYYVLVSQDSLMDTSSDPLVLVDQLVEATILKKPYQIMAAFARLAFHYNLSPVNLYKLYMGKNVLNQFRQDNGYKEGTYRKMWGKVEDNYVLMSLLADPRFSDPDRYLFRKQIRQQLQKYYNSSIDA